jgi:DNA-binding beta-propeller fold protein YncE
VGVAIASDGSLVVADYDNDVLDSVSTAGVVATLTQQSTFVAPFALARGAGNILYAATDANAVGHKDSAAGRLSATVWSITPGSGAAANLSAATGIGYIRGIAVRSDGKIVAADRTNHLIWLIDPTAQTKTVLAGSAGCIGGINGTGVGASFNDPYGVAVLPDDSVVVADYVLRVLRRVSKTGVVTAFAGDGGPAGTIDGPAATARFDRPQALTADTAGIVYLSDTNAHRIRRIDTVGAVTTLAGSGTQGFMDGAGNVAQFNAAEGLAVSADGKTLYVADGTGGSDTPVAFHRIRKITIGP